MEKIIINGMLYSCKNGTGDKLREAYEKGDKAPGMEHENGTAYNDFNDLLWYIIDNKKGTYIDNIFQTF